MCTWQWDVDLPVPMHYMFVCCQKSQTWILPTLCCDTKRWNSCCVFVFSKGAHQWFIPPQWPCMSHWHTHTHTHTRMHVSQRIPTHTVMTPWTGATPSLRVWLPSVQKRWTLQYLDIMYSWKLCVQMDRPTMLAKEMNQIFLIYEWLINRMLLSNQTNWYLFVWLSLIYFLVSLK